MLHLLRAEAVRLGDKEMIEAFGPSGGASAGVASFSRKPDELARRRGGGGAAGSGPAVDASAAISPKDLCHVRGGFGGDGRV